ncbi:3-deoxy-manno-octulosonate cytidylyltransferase [Muricauda sp. JGD-17]|uniref:3-deoxy-manno-octulosonate cytidylyltransferase n=1 Tax=Flagellimonas ochracea TaxID=2696472 RepID=A0A964WX98_9FLAO|nr:3-deoxy-manno-octulosonate cytidylyltransferase [Allomuricauda ochracea]NAY91642.1 3-deoxy-manno-octulosonate cytidylyltransferase [Allomuricauda ochracea]
MKIGYFVTARLKSSRLKQKILLPLNGSTVLDSVIQRCKQVIGRENVVLCTSSNSQDSRLMEDAIDHRIKFFAGSEDDVLQRLLGAAKYYGFDAFLSITADNPLHSMYISNIILDFVQKEPADFVFTSGLPIGLTPYYLNTKALEIAVKMKQKSDTEVWGPFVNRPDFFKIGYLDVETKMFAEDTRLTCDYLEDYEVLRNIFAQFKPDHNPSIFEVAQLFRANIVQRTNNKMIQAQVPEETLQQIKTTFDGQRDYGTKFAKDIGHELLPGENHYKLII